MLVRIIVTIGTILMLQLIVLNNIGCSKDDVIKKQDKTPSYLLKNDDILEKNDDEAQLPKDIETNIKDEQKACKTDSDCRIITIGCCRGEQVGSVNRHELIEIKRDVRKKCRDLEYKYRKQKKTSLCKAKSVFNSMNAKAVCIEGQCEVK